jgi:hypothetical protein
MILPYSIADEHYRALDGIVAGLDEDYDLEQLVPLLIDNLDETALIHLAEWLSVLGVEGWNFAKTDSEKRDLLREAIKIHRKKATPRSIKDALTRAGFVVKRIEEGTGNFTSRPPRNLPPKYPLQFDGTAKFNGAYAFGDGIRTLSPIQFDGRNRFNGRHKFGDSVNAGTIDNPNTSIVAWALFRVVLTWNPADSYTPEVHASVVSIIEAFQNIRSWLTDVQLEFTLADSLEITDSVETALSITMQDIVGVGNYFDGAIKFDGSAKFNVGILDELESNRPRLFEETLTPTDAVEVGVQPTLADSVTITDALTLTSARVEPLEETVTITESLAITIRVTQTESYTMNGRDALSRTIIP